MTNLIKKINTGIAVVLSAAAIAGTFRGLNIWAREDYEIRLPRFRTHVSQEMFGINEVDYTPHSDGYKRLIVRTNFPWDSFETDWYDDFNGDGKTDLITRDNPFRSKILSRKSDYQSHPTEFDEADKKLNELANKYPK